MNLKYIFTIFCLFILFSANILAQLPKNTTELIKKDIPYLENLYKHFHQNPELSLMEINTSKRLAEEMKKIGFQTYENIAGTNLLAVLKNGKGPTILVRCDMDALPIKEETGLDFSSKVLMKDANGNTMPAMHACGHDLHMATWLGSARLMAQLKDKWSGTLMFVAERAEEIVVGAKAMMDYGIYKNYGTPDFALAIHDNADLPFDAIGLTPEYALANVNSVNITIYGEGGHGASPHLTKDPIVMAAKLILDLQTIISREIPAIQPAVLTIGTIHAGTKRNIVPNEVKLEATLRTYDLKIRDLIIEKIKIKANAVAMSAGMSPEKYPTVELTKEFSPALYNEPTLINRLKPVLQNTLGKENIYKVSPSMVSEDFGYFAGLGETKIPLTLLWLGTMPHEAIQQRLEKGTPLPALHSSKFYPVADKSMETGIKAMSASLLELLK